MWGADYCSWFLSITGRQEPWPFISHWASQAETLHCSPLQGSGGLTNSGTDMWEGFLMTHGMFFIGLVIDLNLDASKRELDAKGVSSLHKNIQFLPLVLQKYQILWGFQFTTSTSNVPIWTPVVTAYGSEARRKVQKYKVSRLSNQHHPLPNSKNCHLSLGRRTVP